MLDFSDRTRTGISILTSAAGFNQKIYLIRTKKKGAEKEKQLPNTYVPQYPLGVKITKKNTID